MPFMHESFSVWQQLTLLPIFTPCEEF